MVVGDRRSQAFQTASPGRRCRNSAGWCCPGLRFPDHLLVPRPGQPRREAALQLQVVSNFTYTLEA